ncbi:TPA: KilA-N domain-containing protein [Vibrio cholerae]|nr:KilA-N domain-containing protein [Vibrio cholerae]
MHKQITISSKIIRRDESGLYSLNDLHKASGNQKNHQPSNFLRQSTTKELILEISSSSDMRSTVKALNGRGTWVCKELVYAYAMWISAKFHLLVIRAFDAMVNDESNQSSRQSTATQLTPLRQKVEQLITTGVGNIYGDIWKLVHNKFEVKTIGQLKPEQIPEAIQYLYEIEGEYISKNQKKTIEIPDFRYQRILLTVENGEVTSTRMVGSDEMLMNRYQYINYFKEPDVGFNDVEQLAELSRTVSERLHKQLGKCR